MYVNGRRVDVGVSGAEVGKTMDCPYWQRANNAGQCVDKWYMGPPFVWIGWSVTAAVFGLVVGATLHHLGADKLKEKWEKR